MAAIAMNVASVCLLKKKDDEEEACPDWSEESLTYFRKCVKGEVLKLASMKQSGRTLFVNLLIR